MKRAQKAEPEWREGWDADARRFIVHKWRCDASEGGETWEVIDAFDYAQVALARHRAQAEFIADALEYLANNTVHDQFEPAIKAASVREC